MIKLTPEKPPYYEIIPTAPLPPAVVVPKETVLILIQTGTGNPAITNIKNELTFLTVTRAAIGIYNIAFLLGTLTVNKTVAFTNLSDNISGLPVGGRIIRVNTTTAQLITAADDWAGSIKIQVYL